MRRSKALVVSLLLFMLDILHMVCQDKTLSISSAIIRGYVYRAPFEGPAFDTEW